MKFKFFITFIFLLFFCSQYLQAQTGDVILGANSVYNLPFGTLHDRYTGAVGGMIYAGQQISSNWTWVGKLEYIELDNLNTNKLYKTVQLQVNGATRDYKFPLKKLYMQLKAIGLTAEANLNLIRMTSFETNFTLGFGFYYWQNNRGPYFDSLFADTSGTGSKINVSNLDVPGNLQTDWSGGFNLGLQFSIKVVEPVWINFGAEYKAIIGELWPALALDIENVSSMQFLSFRAGVMLKF